MENSYCDEDWITYSDKKCFKILEKKWTSFEGKVVCNEMDSSSTLITIVSVEEQDFLYKLLMDSKSKNVWIGLEMKQREGSAEINKNTSIYEWISGKPLIYDNFDENADKDKQCVYMSSSGEWRDDYCDKKYLIVCEKKQSNLKSLSKEIHEQMNLMVPIGFLYTQLPNQSSPQQLWPNMKWSDVSPQYAGLFFRADGGGAEPFGQIQKSNQSWISEYQHYGYKPWTSTPIETFDAYGYRKPWYDSGLITKPSSGLGSWTTLGRDDESKDDESKEDLYSGNRIYMGDFLMSSLRFYQTYGEVRPKNTAIKMWKRIQ